MRNLANVAIGRLNLMFPLFPLLPFCNDETPVSWAARQAAFHTGGRMIPFLNDLQISVADLVRGRPEAVIRLCYKAGEDPVPVMHNTISAIGGRRFKLRHLEFAAEFTSGVEMRFCPICLREDQAEKRDANTLLRHRLAWCLMRVRTCWIHHLELQVYREGKWDDKVRDLQRLSQISEMHENAAEEVLKQRPVSPLQSYVQRRVDGRLGPAWLDQQDIDQCVRAAEMLGAVALFGADRPASEMTHDMWDEAGRAAWPMVSEGEETIRAFLVDQIGRKSIKGRTANLVGAFGMLYRWLSASRLTKDPGPIRSILRDVIIETTPLNIGQKVLGEVVTSPRLTSVASLSKTSRLHPMTLLNVFEVAGVVPSSVEGSPIVNYREVAALVDATSNAAPVLHVPDILHASRPMVAALIELKLLTRIQDHNILQSKIGKAIDGRSIQALLRRLDAEFPRVGECPAGYVSLSKAAEKTHATLKVILELLFFGLLKKAVRLVGQAGFAAILVSPEEIKKILDSPPPAVSDDVRFLM